MSTESTRKVLQRYVDSKHTDMSVMANDVVFTNMATGEETRGPDAVGGMLHFLYHIAFNADYPNPTLTCDGDRGVLEGMFVGKHIGEFAGIPATGKEVRVPLTVSYDVENDRIKRGRIYWMIPALFAQLGASPPSA
jgi:predicted ester cyclase